MSATPPLRPAVSLPRPAPWRLGLYVCLLGLLAWPRLGTAEDGWRSTGFIGAEARVFTRTPQFPGQADEDDYSAILQPELRYTSGDQRLTFVPFYRYDSVDEERTHFDMRELNWRKSTRDWDLLAGVGRVFWGVTESRHLVDIINQTDLVENIDQEDKLGQPMVNLNLLRDWGTVGLFVLPGFRERTFPGVDGRLRTPLPVDTDDPQYESGAEETHVDAALRYSHVLGDWDVGAYYFYGTGREPRLIPDPANQRFIPYYDLIQQVGVDLQLTAEAWLWKFEGIAREGQGKTFGAMVAGVEYTFYQLGDSAADLGMLLELLYDDRDETAPPVLFDEDVFVGLRLALNDVDDTQVLAGVVYDPEDEETLFTLEAERRLGEHFTAEFEVRLFSDEPSESLLNAFRRDNYFQLQLAYYF